MSASHSPVLVTGGTGTLGKEVVDRLLDQGRTVRVLSRRPRPESARVEWRTGNLREDLGIDAAVAGVRSVIHCATSFKGDSDSAASLIKAMSRAGKMPLIYISVVGIDRIPMSYYRSKLDAERLIEASALPWTIQRATQFHDLIFRALQAFARSPVMFVPAQTSFQPIDTGDVADRVVDLEEECAGSNPLRLGKVPDIAGPEVLDSSSLAHRYLRARGIRRLVVPVRLPGAGFAALRRGDNLAPEGASGRTTFDDFLRSRLAVDPR